MTQMKFLTDADIERIKLELVAQEFADQANRLARAASRFGLILEVRSVGDSYGIATVRPRDIHAPARLTAVPA